VGRVASTGQWWVAQSNGTSFNNANWTEWSPFVTWVDVQVEDFNGDGRDDLAGRVASTGDWFAAISNGTNAFANALWTNWSPAVTWVDVHGADVDGNGQFDLAGRVQSTGAWFAAISNGSAFTNQLWTTWSPLVTWDDVLVGNFATGPPQPLLAAEGPADDGSTLATAAATPLTQDQLAPLVTAAINLLSASGLSQSQLNLLRQVTVHIADLPDARLGQQFGRSITLDPTAAGHGWFIDPTPFDNEEFPTLGYAGLLAAGDSAAAGHMDLLTALLHELEHTLGLDDDYTDPHSDSLMNGWLITGTRRLPAWIE
jgi:hypothetical protein